MPSPIIQLIECPRDAMQGWPHAIPTATKVNYLSALLPIGFDVLDCGSFVSPKAIPQMADTAQVLPQLQLNNTLSKLLVIVANERGATDASAFEQVTYLGFPFSISETFQKLNTNSTIEQSLSRVEAIQNICTNAGKQMVVYISMGFGNPYGDAYHADVALHWISRLQQIGITRFSLADTVGLAHPADITYTFEQAIAQFSGLTLSAHFHSTPQQWLPKIAAAQQAGCAIFEGAIKGIGGCPMAQDELVGNMDTINLTQHFDTSLNKKFDRQAFNNAVHLSNSVFK
jgi:hydroxymethylglutaryl-CoA lyase